VIPVRPATGTTARIAITGTRTPGVDEEELADLFRRYLAPFDGSASTWMLGGAGGIDTVALRWLTEHGRGDLVVAVPVTTADQPHEARAAIRRAEATGRLVQLEELRHPAGVGPEAFTVRNRWLVEQSEFVVGFPATATEDGSGTWETVNHARSLERPVLVVPVGTAPAEQEC
jgi:predicted Rossmann fold nucleotide-binding protein DprA/Smf involved in DNA uptake